MRALLQRVRDQEARTQAISMRGYSLQRSTATTMGKKPMLRTILTTTALLCFAQAASAQELTAEQRSACMGDYEKYCKGVTPGGGRIIACLAKEEGSPLHLS